ncbi:helix-turn-helix transcriptional regulator [Kribbella qitaiheensis]|uniref:Helix-turn-helix transcriptional regulator n=1 Tax=Kribbella qitaiheensis TaxID=1544730 RepID=A0A7G6X6Q2_9ACTN|nr:helix-turn-helix transcriptional regulator [Kribbella qitaiheensis]QNE21917.1 helix-turn-helix transcriptional regulator [Kribbella qitaiheensis]
MDDTPESPDAPDVRGAPEISRTGELIRKRRTELRMSQAELAEKVGVGIRQIRRYEAGEQQPLLLVGVAIAEALKVSVTELAGATLLHRISLSGEWWMAWQTSQHGQEVITSQTVMLTQQGDLIHVKTNSRGSVTLDEGGYNWRGEMRLWDNKVLLGWYAAEDGAVNSKGTLYFVLHNHGINALGMWTGLSHDGNVVSGWGVLARSEDEARAQIAQLKKTVGATALRMVPPTEGLSDDAN